MCCHSRNSSTRACSMKYLGYSCSGILPFALRYLEIWKYFSVSLFKCFSVSGVIFGISPLLLVCTYLFCLVYKIRFGVIIFYLPEYSNTFGQFVVIVDNAGQTLETIDILLKLFSQVFTCVSRLNKIEITVRKISTDIRENINK